MPTTRSPRGRRTEKNALSSRHTSPRSNNGTNASKEESRRTRVPEFKNRQEEAEFWDTHSFTDYWDEFTPVKVRVAKKLSEPVTMRIDLTALEGLRDRAAKMGVGATTLIRIWILERLQAEHDAERPKRRRKSA